MATLKKITITARDAGRDPDGEACEPYLFTAWELPSGECVVSYPGTNDGWFADRDAIEASGFAQVEGVEEETGETVEWTAEEIAESVAGSAREFGVDAIPPSLRPLLADDRAEILEAAGLATE